MIRARVANGLDIGQRLTRFQKPTRPQAIFAKQVPEGEADTVVLEDARRERIMYTGFNK
jgi:hypothetical protein